MDSDRVRLMRALETYIDDATGCAGQCNGSRREAIVVGDGVG